MSESTLARRFGFWTGWFVVVASMVGSGILTTSGPILRTTGSYGDLIALWTVGGALALAGALTMGELASGLPRVGGDYVFVREAFGPAWGFVYGWAMVILGFAAPIALVAYTTANYLQPALVGALRETALGGAVAAPEFIGVAASALIVFFTASHCLGHRGSSVVQSSTTVFKLAVLLAFVVMAPLSPKASWSAMAEGVSKGAGIAPLASGLILVMYAYMGWNAAVYLAGEIREPARKLPRCLIWGCFSVAVLYVLVNLAYGVSLSAPEVAALSESDANRLAEVSVSKLFGADIARVFSFLVSLGVLASLSAYVLTGPRIVFAMARDGLFPSLGGKVHSRTGAPVVATIVQGMLALMFLWSGTFEQVLTFTGYGLGVISTLVIAPIFVLRRRPDFRPEFRVPLYPWTPIAFLTVNVLMLIGGAVDTPGLALASVLSVLAGFPVYWLWTRVGSRSNRPR